MRMRQGMGMGGGVGVDEIEDDGEDGDEDMELVQVADRKGRGRDLDHYSPPYPNRTSKSAREQRWAGLRGEKGFDMCTPPTSQSAQLGWDWGGEMVSKDKEKGKGKEVERDFGPFGGSWNNKPSPHIQPLSSSKAKPSYHQKPSFFSASGGWMNSNPKIDRKAIQAGVVKTNGKGKEKSEVDEGGGGG